MFGIILMEHLISWMEPNFKIEGRRENEKERYANIFPNHNYLPFTILTIYSINIKVIHLTTSAFR